MSGQLQASSAKKTSLSLFLQCLPGRGALGLLTAFSEVVQPRPSASSQETHLGQMLSVSFRLETLQAALPQASPKVLPELDLSFLLMGGTRNMKGYILSYREPLLPLDIEKLGHLSSMKVALPPPPWPSN